MHTKALQKHVLSIHFSLRIGMVALTLAFPLILWLGGEVQGISLQDTMSAYYFASNDGHSMHDWFVGILFAAATLLYIYKGFSRQEDWALTLGGVCAIGIAVYPTIWNCSSGCLQLTTHDIFAILFLICMAYVCVFRASDTLYLMEHAGQARKFRRLYQAIGGCMVLTALLAVLQTMVLRQYHSYAYFAQMGTLWTFSIYWIAKSVELAISMAEHRLLHDMVADRMPEQNNVSVRGAQDRA